MAERKDNGVSKLTPIKRTQAVQLKQEVQTQYTARNAMIKEMRQRRYQGRTVYRPEDYRQITQEVRLPILNDLLDLQRAIVDDAPWRCHVNPYDETVTASRNAAVRERWSEAALVQAQQLIGRAALSNATDNQMADGRGVLKVLYRPDRWTDVPTARKLFGRSAADIDEEELRELTRRQENVKRGAGVPFSIVDVDPITWFPIYGPDGELQACIEITERPIRSVLAEYQDRLAVNQSGSVVLLSSLGEPQPAWYDTVRDVRSTVEVWEYWDREEHAAFVQDIPIKYVRHGLGRVPYFDFVAKPSPSRDLEISSRPPIYKLKWVADLLDSFWTMMSNSGYLYCYPTPVIETPPGAVADQRNRGLQWTPGKLMVLEPGQKIQFVSPPAENVRMFADVIGQALGIFEASSGLGPAIRGVGGSDQPGYALNQLIQASMMSLKPAIVQRDAALAELIKFLWRLIEKRIKDDVWVWGTNPETESTTSQIWLRLGPDDIQGYYHCSIESKPLIDQMVIARGSFAAQMVRAKLMSRRRGISEYLGVEDPDGELDDIWVDEAESSGPLHDMAITQAMRKAGLQSPPPKPAPPGPEMGMAPTGGAVPPAGPGVGMALVNEPPPNPGMSAGQIQDVGGIGGPGGRPAGADRMPPSQAPASMQAQEL
ncbi:MAG: hypothetical protein U0821_18565 [Chloroflexota bacterium]